jgi:hypothetical protein
LPHATISPAENRARLCAEERLLCHVQIAAADSAASDLDQHFIGGGLGLAHVFDDERLMQGLEDGGFHGPMLAQAAVARNADT